MVRRGGDPRVCGHRVPGAAVSWALRALAGWVLVVACASGWAFTGETHDYSSGTSTSRARGPGGAQTFAAPGVGAGARGAVMALGPGGSRARVGLEVLVARRGVLQMAAASLGALAGSPLVWAGFLAWDVYRDFRVRPNGEGGIVRDPGIPPVPDGQEYYCGSGAQRQVGRSRGEACGRFVSVAYPEIAGQPQGWQAYGHEVFMDRQFQFYECTDGSGPCYQTRAHYYTASGNYDTGWSPWTHAAGLDWGLTGEQVHRCPPIFGQFAEIYEVEPMADGLCWSSGDPRVGSVISPEVAADLPEAASITWEQYERLLREAVGLVPDIPFPVAHSTQGYEGNTVPFPRVPGPTTTTTNAQGTTTATTEHTLRPLPAASTGARGAWDTTTTTITTDPSGQFTGHATTTTTVPGAGEGASGAPGSETEPVDPCKLNPDTIGCSKWGDVPDSELGKRDVSVTVVPAGGWGPSTASCPPPDTANVLGITLSLRWDAYCDFASGIRPWVLSAAAVAAALLLVGAFRGNA